MNERIEPVTGVSIGLLSGTQRGLGKTAGWMRLADPMTDSETSHWAHGPDLVLTILEQVDG